MLLFIARMVVSICRCAWFQYISCCYLSKQKSPVSSQKNSVSIHLMLLFILKTSILSTTLPLFQYISCCYLSSPALKVKSWVFVSIHLMLLFILRSATTIFYIAFVSIHLMLLFILTFCLAEIFGPCFNTSHVVIYRNLLITKQLIIALFQYISCCYLSNYPFLQN